MRITRRGQVTIPRHIRERAGLLPGTEVVVVLVDGEVRIRKATTPGERLVAQLRGTGRKDLSTDEIIMLMRGPSADDEIDSGASRR